MASCHLLYALVCRHSYKDCLQYLLTTVIGCKGLIIVRRRILLASEQAPLLSPLRTLSLKGKKRNNTKPNINVLSIVNQLVIELVVHHNDKQL